MHHYKLSLIKIFNTIFENKIKVSNAPGWGPDVLDKKNILDFSDQNIRHSSHPLSEQCKVTIEDAVLAGKNIDRNDAEIVDPIPR